MEFRYIALESSGKKIKSLIEAANIEEARKKLKAQGVVFSELSESSGEWGNIAVLLQQRRISNERLSVLSRDLAVYLKAGIPLPRALLMLKRQSVRESRDEHFFDALSTSISEGKSFAQSLETQRWFSLPQYYTGTLKISEDRGILAEVLSELSVYLSVQEKIRKQITQALIYPGFIVIAAIFMISFMLSVVVPKITSVFETTGQALPSLTQGIISMSTFLGAYWWLLVVLMFAMVIIFTAKIKSDYRFRKKIHKMILLFPVVGDMIATADLSRFATISAMLMRSGIPAVQAIRLSSATLSSEVLKELFEFASMRVVEGSKLSDAIKQFEGYAIDPSFIEAVSVGEETSELASMLSHLGELYQETNKDKIAVFLSILEPTLMLIIGGVVGVIVTAMLLPIFSLSLG